MSDLIRLERIPEDQHDFPHDIERMKDILNRNGLDASDSDIAWAWEQYSDSSCAGWLALGDDEQYILAALFIFLKVP